MRNQKIILISLITTLVILSLTFIFKKPNEDDEPIINDGIKIVHLIDEVDHGLNMITLKDSTTILLYRGVESCTMIQLK